MAARDPEGLRRKSGVGFCQQGRFLHFLPEEIKRIRLGRDSPPAYRRVVAGSNPPVSRIIRIFTFSLGEGPRIG